MLIKSHPEGPEHRRINKKQKQKLLMLVIMMTMTMQMMMTLLMIQHLYKWDNSCPPRWSGRPQGKSTWGSPAQAPTCRTQLSRPCNHSYDSCFLFLQRNIFYITISHVGGFKCDEHLHSQRVHLRGTKVSPCVRWGVSSSRGSQAAVGEDFLAGADFLLEQIFYWSRFLLEEILYWSRFFIGSAGDHWSTIAIYYKDLLLFWF